MDFTDETTCPWERRAILGLGFALLVTCVVLAAWLRSPSSLVVLAAFGVGGVLVLCADFSKLNLGPAGLTAERRDRLAEIRTEEFSAVARSDIAELSADERSVKVELAETARSSDTFTVERFDADGNLTSPPADAGTDAWEAEQKRRLAIERLMRTAAEWGFSMAEIGFKSAPAPLIDWTASGQPVIRYGRGVGASPGSSSEGTLSAGGPR